VSAAFAEQELETLRRGALGAGLLVAVSDRGFLDTFKEAGSLAKHVAAARKDSQSSVVRQLAEGGGLPFGITTPPKEIEAGTLSALRASVELLERKAPSEVAAYKAFVLDLAHSVAAAAGGGDQLEAGTIERIEAALAGDAEHASPETRP